MRARVRRMLILVVCTGHVELSAPNPMQAAVPPVYGHIASEEQVTALSLDVNHRAQLQYVHSAPLSFSLFLSLVLLLCSYEFL